MVRQLEITPTLQRVKSEMQDAFAAAGGGTPSLDEAVNVKWFRVAHAVLYDERLRHIEDPFSLAVTMHDVFLGEGHRTLLYDRQPGDAVVKGWMGSAGYVIAKRPYESLSCL